jgi:hypothetical protein
VLRKVIFNQIKQDHGLHEDDEIAEYMIPTTFNEETEFLSDNNTNSLKHHYMTIYWKVRKDFLDYIEDSMSHDSFIGSTIRTRSNKNASCSCNISSPSVLSHDTKTSYQRKSTHMTFTLNISIMQFYLNLTMRDIGTILRRNLKKFRIL